MVEPNCFAVVLFGYLLRCYKNESLCSSLRKKMENICACNMPYTSNSCIRNVKCQKFFFVDVHIFPYQGATVNKFVLDQCVPEKKFLGNCVPWTKCPLDMV
jgi:hypothetical protein